MTKCTHPSGLFSLTTQGLENVLRQANHRQLYVLGEFPFLLIRCDCPDSAHIEPDSIYEPLTPEQARQWMESHE